MTGPRSSELYICRFITVNSFNFSLPIEHLDGLGAEVIGGAYIVNVQISFPPNFMKLYSAMTKLRGSCEY